MKQWNASGRTLVRGCDSRCRSGLPDSLARRPFESRALILRVVRDRKSHSFWESDLRIQADDKLIVIGAHPDERQ
jgi:hypothetical protein